MTDPFVFAIGVAAGAVAVLPWLWPVLTKYVIFSRCPAPQRCPHHIEAWRARITTDNANTRNGPTRPPIR